MNTYQLKLDLNKGPTYNVGMAYSGITLRQGDKRGCTVVAELYDHGTRFTEAGYTAYFVMGLPDREHYYREAATYSSGTVSIIIDESVAASVAGDTIAYFELTKGGATYSTQGIKVSVLKDARADKTPGETYDSRIEQAIEDLETAIAQAETQIEADVAEWLDQHPEATTTVQDNSITYAKLHSSTKQRLNNKLHRLVTAPVVTASDAYAAPPVALVVDGKSVQDGTPTPDAPVAIQSVESVGLAAAGVNFLDPSTFASRSTVYTANSDGSITVTATDGALWTNLPYVPLVHGTYTFSRSNASGTSAIGLVDAQGTPLNYVYVQNGVASVTFTVPAGAAGARVKVGYGAPSYPFTTTVQLEYGSTATPYVPYVGSTTPIPLQGHALRSLPDGTHDELRVDADGAVTLVQRVGHVVLDGSIAPSGATAAAAYFNISSLGILPPVLTTRGSMGYCNRYEVNSNFIASTPVDNRVVINASVFSGTPRIAFYDSTHAGSFATWLASNPVTVDYPLATPVEIPLGTVTLPVMPAPDLTALASCTPATEIGLDYERDVSLVIAALEAQIAELATN